MPTLTDTASPLEVLWTLFCLGGCFIAWLNLSDAIEDLAAQRDASSTSARILLARGEVFDQSLITIQLLLLTVAGLAAMLTPPASDPGEPPTLGALVLPPLFIAAAACMVYGSIARKRRRKRAIAVLLQLRASQRRARRPNRERTDA